MAITDHLRSSCHLCSTCGDGSGTCHIRSSHHLCCSYHLCCSSADYNIDDCHAFLPSDDYSPFDHNNHNSCSQACNSCKEGGGQEDCQDSQEEGKEGRLLPLSKDIFGKATNALRPGIEEVTQSEGELALAF